MRIGVLATVSRLGGGVYQYTQSLVKSLLEYTNYDFLIIRNSAYIIPGLSRFHNNHFVEIKIRPSDILLKIKRVLYISFPASRKFLDVLGDYRILREKYNFDFIISPIISLVPIYLGCPYIVTIHDFQHCYYPEFFTLKERLLRNYVYKHAVRNASLIICESNFVKDDIVKFLNVPQERIRVIVSPPALNLYVKNMHDEECKKVKNKYNLRGDFLFYPAQFWYHKNHLNLVEAINFLKEKYGERITLVLVGSKKNNFENVFKKVKDLGIEKQIRWLGYVPEGDMPYFYKLATALVMPTLFESVSMPIWEAFHLGCPVVSSNVCALPEQVGDAGLLFDPNNVEDMAEKIYRIWIDENLRKELIQRGYERIKDSTMENYARKWEKIIEEVAGNGK